jgi:hypothetical protein
MATITADIKPKAGGVRRIIWETMGDDDTGSAVEHPDYPDKTVSVEGTFSSATVVIQGSNDGTNYETLTDLNGSSLSFTSAPVPKTIRENPLFIRASTSGGGGADIDVIIVAAK